MTEQHYDGGELMVAAIEDFGADYIFCSSGSEWAPVWEALARREADGEPAPEYLDLLHETVATGMATGYGLVTRRVQGVLLHTAPGLLQGAVGIHGALLAGVAMVVTSSESSTYGDGSGPDPGGQWYRNLSIVGGPHVVAAPFTKWSSQVGSASTLHGMTTRAAELAARAPAGPVYLNVPLEVLLERVEAPKRPKRTAAKGRRVAVASDVDAVAALLAGARRPIVLTETAGREPGGFEALTRFAEELAVGVVEPQSAVCANLPTDSPMHLGADVESAVREADLVILVNCRAPFYPPSSKPTEAPVVVVDEVPQRPHIVYQVLHADHYLEGGLPETLDALRVAVLERGDVAALEERRSAFSAEHDAYVAETARMEEASLAQPGIDPVRLAVALRDVVRDRDAVVVDETITHSRVVQRHIGKTAADRYFYVQGGLGQGMAVAMGAKLADRDRFTILTIGDGSFLYNPIVQSLQASKDYRLPLLIVIFNNKKYLSMQMNHLRFYPDGAAMRTGRWLGVDLASQPELSAFAEPFGMYHAAVDDPGRLDAVLAEAVASVERGVTAVVNVAVDR